MSKISHKIEAKALAKGGGPNIPLSHPKIVRKVYIYKPTGDQLKSAANKSEAKKEEKKEDKPLSKKQLKKLAAKEAKKKKKAQYKEDQKKKEKSTKK
jgi:hypothetical protein